jgi:hypothetical protein
MLDGETKVFGTKKPTAPTPSRRGRQRFILLFSPKRAENVARRNKNGLLISGLRSFDHATVAVTIRSPGNYARYLSGFKEVGIPLSGSTNNPKLEQPLVMQIVFQPCAHGLKVIDHASFQAASPRANSFHIGDHLVRHRRQGLGVS